MLDEDVLVELQNSLVARAGGYLRNTLRQPGLTCEVCATPVGRYTRCYPCSQHHGTYGRKLADAVAALTYAVGGQQTAYMMRGYKATPEVTEHRVLVSMLSWVGISLHTACAGTMGAMPVTHWAAVPSLPAKSTEHPFHRIIAASPPTALEVPLIAATEVENARGASPSHFAVAGRLPVRSHVLVVDDTWTQGGHAQSAALALRAAGAERISILVAARWINRAYGDNEAFVRQLTDDFDPRRCPWTGQACPR